MAGVGVHSKTKSTLKNRNIPNIYMIFYFEIVGKAYKNKIQNALYKVFSVWEPHVIGHSCGLMKNGILLYTLAMYRHAC